MENQNHGTTNRSPSSFISAPLTPGNDLSPEIYFLIREHAKTLAAINQITQRLEVLENKVEDICKKVQRIDRLHENSRGGGGGGGRERVKKGESSTSSSSGTTPNALSDDSGVEYSRTTTGTGQDDDELLSLLNQITKFSDSIKQTLLQPSNSNIPSPMIPRSGHHPHHHPHLHHPLHHQQQHLLASPGETGSMVYGLTGSTPSSTIRQSNSNNIKSVRHHHSSSSQSGSPGSSASPRHQHQPQQPQQSPSRSGVITTTPSTSASIRKTLISPLDQSRLRVDYPHDHLSSAPQSFSALLFESNVDHFLANLDLVPESVRASDFYYPPSMPVSPPPPPLPPHHLHHHPHHPHQHIQPLKTHSVLASRLLTETLHPHDQPDQQ